MQRCPMVRLHRSLARSCSVDLVRAHAVILVHCTAPLVFLCLSHAVNIVKNVLHNDLLLLVMLTHGVAAGTLAQSCELPGAPQNIAREHVCRHRFTCAAKCTSGTRKCDTALTSAPARRWCDGRAAPAGPYPRTRLRTREWCGCLSQTPMPVRLCGPLSIGLSATVERLKAART